MQQKILQMQFHVQKELDQQLNKAEHGIGKVPIPK
jgi:hypothetical protein